MDFIKKAIESLKNPKTRSLTLLGFYAVFFIFVFIVLSGGNSTTPNYEVEENTNGVSNYEYIYNINNNDIINTITGTLKNNEDVFNYNSLNYIKKDGIVYLNGVETIIDFDVDKYKYNNIELLIENSDFDTIYKESDKVIYNMSANEYFALLNEQSNCSNIDCMIINVPITVESSEYIYHVIIDLSNYYGYKYQIEINYNNINQVQ